MFHLDLLMDVVVFFLAVVKEVSYVGVRMYVMCDYVLYVIYFKCIFDNVHSHALIANRIRCLRSLSLNSNCHINVYCMMYILVL